MTTHRQTDQSRTAEKNSENKRERTHNKNDEIEISEKMRIMGRFTKAQTVLYYCVSVI